MRLTSKILKKFTLFVAHYIRFITTKGPSLFYIVEVNIKKQTVTIHCPTASIHNVITLTISEAIANQAVIKNLSPNQAGWLGAFYGKALTNSTLGKHALKKVMAISVNTLETGTYIITSEKRSGKIRYLDKHTGKEFVEHPIAIASHAHIISKFSSPQACYIGLLAGIAMEETKIKSEASEQQRLQQLLKKPPKLRIVS